MRRKIASLLGAAMVAGVMSVSMPVASAQTGYPPGPCVPANVVVDYGTHNIGSTFTIRMVTRCLWNPGDTVNITVNGQAAGPKTVDAAGAITINIAVTSATQLAINDPVLVKSQCGENNAVGVSPSAAAGGAMESYTATFRVNCQAAAATSGSVAGGVAFTGANVAKWGGIALVLMAGGWLLVGIARRRRATPSA